MQDMDTSLSSSSIMSSQTEVSLESSAENTHKKSHNKGEVHACNTNSYSHKECYNNNYHYTINNSVGTMTTYQYPPGMQSVRSIGVQCNLLAVPPLQKLSKAEEEIDRQIISDSEDADVTDLDTSFQTIQEDTTTE